MSGFVDIHTHILPSVDDGAENMQEACEMVRMAWQDGTKVLFLTPHYRGDCRHYSPQNLQEVFLQLREQVAEEMPDVRLFLGTEIRYDAEVPEKLAQGQILSMGGSDFVLLEFGTQAIKSQILMGVTEVLRYGFVPIIAHAERCDAFHAFPALIDEVRDMGGYIQINADSIMGAYGFAMKRFSHKLLKERKVHFVATDSHHSQKRPPLLNKCFLRVSKKYGEEYAKRVFYQNACRLMQK